jgi:hypothetical protein
MQLEEFDDENAIKLFHVRVSESELEVYEACIDYVVNNVKSDLNVQNDLVENEAGGATLEELVWMRNDIRYLMLKYIDEEYLPTKSLFWDIEALEKEYYGE